MKNPYPEESASHRYDDGGSPLPTKWTTHPVTGETTVLIFGDRNYRLIEPAMEIDTGSISEPAIQMISTETDNMSEPAIETDTTSGSEPKNT